MTTKELGNLGEKLACEYIVEKGFKILGKNWRIKLGEIDIIAKKRKRFLDFLKNNQTIHFVEVKALQGLATQSIRPQDHVDFKKKRKLAQLAQIWLIKNKYPQNMPYQIDIVAVQVEDGGQGYAIEYFPNAVNGSFKK